ncbi:hypothetical protein [Cohnella zeiphila]|uniref:Glycosyltransferase RgtA/B/C/D-like domain-containing protein n=1 Tax=Cohnella zeiphila TaxID=2761120 RepID=A0A7X0VVB0_9BACL|nr:hypothetical protein [Cohnella zeiphila]MBB6731781.1 hypothetical protein [Cohnella zeiphila]
MEENRIEPRLRRFYPWGAALLLAAAVAVRLWTAAETPGFYSDQRLFVQWMQAADNFGLGGAYTNDANLNYPPFFLLLLEGYGRVLGFLGIEPQAGAFSFKALIVVIDLFALAAAMALISSIRSRKWKLLVLALFALNPAFVVDGPVWGQVEMLHGMLMVLSVWQATRRPWLSGLLASLALLTKFQAVTVLPVVGLYLLLAWFQERRKRPLLEWSVCFALPFAAAVLYFQAGGGLGAMIRQAYTDAVGMYANVSLNAMNVWYYVTGLNPADPDTARFADLLPYRALGLLLFAMAALYACVYLIVATGRRTASESVDGMLFKASAAINLAFFMLPTEIHERYSLPALLFFVFAVIHDRKWLAPAIALTATVTVNLVAVLRKSGSQGGFGGQAANGRGGAARRLSGGFGNGSPPAGRSLGSDGFQGGGPSAGFGGNSRPGDWGGGRGPFGGMGGGFGSHSALSSAYAWVAAVNVVILLLVFWLLWREMRAAGKGAVDADRTTTREIAPLP